MRTLGAWGLVSLLVAVGVMGCSSDEDDSGAPTAASGGEAGTSGGGPSGGTGNSGATGGSGGGTGATGGDTGGSGGDTGGTAGTPEGGSGNEPVGGASGSAGEPPVAGAGGEVAGAGGATAGAGGAAAGAGGAMAGAGGVSAGAGGAAAGAGGAIAGAGGAAGGAPLIGKRVFVSSDTYEPNVLGSARGADTLCQGLADDALLGGTWMAWISDGATSPQARFTHSTDPYVLLNGTQIAADWSNLVDGAIDAPINADENGEVPSGEWVWTGTSIAGNAGVNTCNNWTNATNSYTGSAGLLTMSTGGWTSAAGWSCDAGPRHIYCFEQ